MSGSQPEIYTITCLLKLGDDISVLEIKIASNESVAALKKAIKTEKSNGLIGIDADTLKLYRVHVSQNEDIKVLTSETLEKAKDLSQLKELENPIAKLGKVFSNSTLLEDTIHILVLPPTSAEGDSGSGKRKRSLSDAGNQDDKRRRLIENLPVITPSSVKMKDLTRYLKSGVAYNRPEASCATIPIALLHQVFAEFLENCQHHVTTVQDNRWLLDLRRAMLLEYAEEGGRASRFREIFTIHTDIDLPNATVPNTKDQTDGHFAINRHFLLITEAKNEWIGIAADPQLQAFVYYIESVRALVKTSEIFKRSPLPCLIIYYVGSLIGFAGVATGAKAQFEPLTPLFDLATNQHDTLALKAVARTLGAVRIALNSLRKYYSELKGLHPSHAMDSPIYPSRTYYTNGSNTRVEFDYKARLDEDKLLFRVLTREDGQERIVKFTQKYSKQAHEYSAAHGIAPILYAVERIGGGWMMIVMEYLNKDNYTLLRDSSIPLENRSNIVANAVSILHQGGYVHGDIRDVNIMVRCDWNAVDSSSGIKLLDFDWAGLDGQAQYPANVNHEGIRRPQEAIDGQHITKDHDITMVGYL